MSGLVDVGRDRLDRHHKPEFEVLSTPQASPAADHRRWPLYWFARLEAALEDGDLEDAATAQAELMALGLRVEVIAPWRGEESCHGR
jgi:hypothetical protein